MGDSVRCEDDSTDSLSINGAGYKSYGSSAGAHRLSDASLIQSADKNLSSDCIGGLLCKCRCPCCRKRYLTAILCCLGFVISFGIRSSAGVATSYFRILYNSTLGMNATETKEQAHQWSSSVVSSVDSSYYIGYIVTHVPSGIMASRFSATRVFGIAILIPSLLNLFLPVAFNTHFGLVICIRVLQGLFDGCTYPTCHGIWRYWAPPLDRSRLVTIAFSGAYIGAFMGLVLSGVLTEFVGWQAPFYLYGAIGILWFCIWHLCIYDKPSVHPCISADEKSYIEESIGENININDKIRDIPWPKIFTSMPVYAIIAANFARNWSFYLLLTEPTKYFADVFKYDMSESGIFSALPHLVMAIIVPVGGQVADELRKRLLSTTTVRKLFNCIGFGMEAVLLLGVGYSSSAYTAIICLVVAVSFTGLTISGFNVNHLDIAPRYASILMGLSNGIGTIASVLVPAVTVQLVRDHSQESWSRVFLTASLIHIAGVIFYAIFASGEKQDWAEPTAKDDEHETPSPTRRRSSAGGKSDNGGNRNGEFPDIPLFPASTVSTFVQESRSGDNE